MINEVVGNGESRVKTGLEPVSRDSFGKLKTKIKGLFRETPTDAEIDEFGFAHRSGKFVGLGVDSNSLSSDFYQISYSVGYSDVSVKRLEEEFTINHDINIEIPGTAKSQKPIIDRLFSYTFYFRSRDYDEPESPDPEVGIIVLNINHELLTRIINNPRYSGVIDNYLEIINTLIPDSEPIVELTEDVARGMSEEELREYGFDSADELIATSALIMADSKRKRPSEDFVLKLLKKFDALIRVT